MRSELCVGVVGVMMLMAGCLGRSSVTSDTPNEDGGPGPDYFGDSGPDWFVFANTAARASGRVAVSGSGYANNSAGRSNPQAFEMSR